MATNTENKKWTTVRVLKEQYKRLSNDVKTPEAKKLGYNSVADALKQAISNVCNEIEDDIKDSTAKANAEVDSFLDEMHVLLEPTSHCCQCTPGPSFNPRHARHVQIPQCRCNPENYVLSNNKQ